MIYVIMKRKKVCIKTRSTPASFPHKGQVTKKTTMNWSIFLVKGKKIELLFITIHHLINVPRRCQKLVKTKFMDLNSLLNFVL